ncbi:alternative RNA polymerase sigma factor SIGI [Mycobacterium tuberculosis]|nr:alternative RNA polymerase sigma factor SIGI [Mycobacterium tuberculosis]
MWRPGCQSSWRFAGRATVLVAQPVCGQPAVLAFVNRALAGVLALSIEAGKITKIHVLVQPSTLDPLRAELGGG